MSAHFHKTASSFGETERGCRQMEKPQHDHENAMDHKFLRYTSCRPKKYESNIQRERERDC